MVNYITDRKSKKEVLKGFEPLIRKWFNSKFDDLTPVLLPLVILLPEKTGMLARRGLYIYCWAFRREFTFPIKKLGKPFVQ